VEDTDRHTDPVSQALNQPEIDDILGVIDAYESTPSTRNSKDSLFIQSFGVFDPTYESPVPSLEGPSPDTASSDSDAPLRLVTSGNANVEQYYSAAITQIPNLLPNANESDLYLDGEIDLLPETNSIDGFTSSWLAIGDLPQPEPSASERGTESHSVDINSSFYAYASSGTIRQNPTSSTLPEQEQFLMHHYSHHAVNLFCVIDNRKSPWKTIHLPRALQSIGQLNVSGSSSDIRNSLRNALLSISAFHLSNDNKARYCHEDATKWSRKAIVLRGKAIALLKNAMNEHFKNKAELKYKEFLATMLSMVTINVSNRIRLEERIHLTNANR
jgi:arginine metabolism regulation protein II